VRASMIMLSGATAANAVGLGSRLIV
jgi:hypothetical protein